jgi:RNA polymerase sigma-70 factor (ECF subfamily)
LAEPLDFNRAYQRFFPPIRAKSWRLLGRSAAADDVAQEVFLRWWQSGPATDAETRTVMAWLYRTCTRLSIDVLRERRRVDATELDWEQAPCGLDLAARTEAKAAIAALVHAVPATELEAAVLCRVDGLSHMEVALVLGVSDRTVRRLLSQFDQRVDALDKDAP